VQGYDREIRLFAVDCVLEIKHLLHDSRSRNALAVATKYANGQCTLKELDTAWDAAWDAARAAAWDVAWAAAWDVAWAAAWDVARAKQVLLLRKWCLVDHV
jgi:hypothetical protein